MVHSYLNSKRSGILVCVSFPSCEQKGVKFTVFSLLVITKWDLTPEQLQS